MNWKRKEAVQSYEAYHAAMRRAEKVLRNYLKNGTLFWNSSERGTYRRGAKR